MAKDTSGQVTVWGIPIDKAISVLQTVGVPTLFMIFVCVMLWQYVPQVVAGHVQLLERTGATLEKMDETLRQSNVMMKEILSVEQETKGFINKVNADHEKALKSLDTIEKAVTPNGN